MRVVFYLIWLVLLVIFQPTLARGIEIWGIAPNLFLCFVVMIGFFRGKREGALCGALFGLVYDLMIGRMIGISALIYLYLGFGAGVLSVQFFSGGKRLFSCLAAMGGTLLAGLAYYLARKATQGDVSFMTAMLRISLPEAVYNGAVTFLLAYPIRWSMKLLRVKRDYESI